MIGQAAIASATAKLKGLLANKDSDEILGSIIDSRDEVLSRYGEIFKLDRIDALAPEDFASFLLFENNRHWGGLHRRGKESLNHFDDLKDALRVLLDDEKPLKDRLNYVVPDSARVTGFGRAAVTAILMVAFPDKYGVWNGPSEAALRLLEVWPKFTWGASFGERFELMNDILLRLSKEVGVDLWTLDALFYRVKTSDKVPDDDGGQDDDGWPGVTNVGFTLEKYLHEFLDANWGETELGREWAIYEEDGEVVGSRYQTEVGEIDILARHRKKPRWLVVELKRNQTSDQTVGQVLRYIGWVRQNLAKDGEEVHGVIICRQGDKGLRYALSTVQNVELQLYQVEFHLKAPETTPGPGAGGGK